MTFIVKTTTALLLGCILICCTESNVIAQDAEVVFNRCVHRLGQINESVTNAQRRTLRECVPRIKRLLEMGEIEEARHVAQRCRARLDSLAERGIGALRDTCRPCLQRLRELEAYALARRLLERCQTHAQQLAQQNQRAKNIISELF